mgnify:CR=1 FL=1
MHLGGKAYLAERASGYPLQLGLQELQDMGDHFVDPLGFMRDVAIKFLGHCPD